MASPAQVANDMEVRAKFWWGRNDAVAAACRDATRVIRAYLFGPPPDGRTVQDVLTRLDRLDGEFLGLGACEALARAAATITQLRKEARDGKA